MISLRTLAIGLVAVLFVFADVAAQHVLWGPVDGGNPTGSIIKIKPDGQGLTKVKEFDIDPDGWIQMGSSIMEGADGKYIGVASHGGTHNRGTIFKLDPDNMSFEKLHDFTGANGWQPTGNFVQATDGKLYGVTYIGSEQSNYGGVVYRIDPDGSNFTVVHSFESAAGGGQCGIIQATDGKLYGTTVFGGAHSKGILYSLELNGNFQVLYEFDEPGRPIGPVVEGSDGSLYGNLDDGNGAAFRIDKDGSDFEVIHEFDGSLGGFSPKGALLQAGDGFLYGVTSGGGAHAGGTIFRLATDGNSFTKVLDFNYHLMGGVPQVGLSLGEDGRLHGVNTFEGPNATGTVYAIDTDGSDFAVISSLNADVGTRPVSASQTADGDWLVACMEGGDRGTIVRIKGDGSLTEKLHDFYVPNDGQFPQSLTLSPDGYLFGATTTGGEHADGVLFRIDPATQAYQKIFDFDNQVSGKAPRGLLVVGFDGFLYGTTKFGGTNGSGTVFKIRKDGSGYELLKDFGDLPLSSNPTPLILGDAGFLYGMVEAGGPFGSGYIYKISTDGSVFSSVFEFTGSNGSSPRGRLLLAEDGKLYGVTFGGGENGKGVAFTIAKDGTGYTKLIDFDGSGNGAYPESGFIQGADDLLYGTTSFGGVYDFGTIFKISTTGQYTKLKDLNHNAQTNSLLGIVPKGEMIQTPDGTLFGMTSQGGEGGVGVIFQIDPDGSDYEHMLIFGLHNGLAIGSGTLTLVPDKAHQAVEFSPIGSWPIGTEIKLRATSDADLPFTFTSSNPFVANVFEDRLFISGVGTATITASNPGNEEYYPAAATQLVTVVKGTPLTAIQSPSKGAVGTTIELYTYSQSWSGVTYSIANGTGEASLSGSTLSLLSEGTVTVTATIPANQDWNETTATQVITITDPSPSVFFDCPGHGFVGSTITLSVNTGGSEGTVTYTVVNDTGEATLDGNVLTLVSPGTVFVKASVAAEENFLSATADLLIAISATNSELYNKAQFWGATGRGGRGDVGVLFRANGDGTGYTVAKHFIRDEMSSTILEPEKILLAASDGKLYGTFSDGGRYNQGILYRLDPGTREYTTLHHFKPSEGRHPTGPLVEHPNGKIYGVTSYTGALDHPDGNDGGTIFSFDPADNSLSTLYILQGDDGLFPTGLAFGADGLFYGVTTYGGADFAGTVFKFDPNGNVFTKMFDLGVASGTQPKSWLTLANDNKLYGLASSGGAHNKGTIIEINPVGPTLNKRLDIPSSVFFTQEASFVLASNGKLYTSLGRLAGFDPVTGTLEITEFSSHGTPFAGPGDKLYYTIALGDYGYLFEYDVSYSANNMLFNFSPATGGYLAGGVTFLNNKLYGIKAGGGINNEGELYEFDLATRQLIGCASFGGRGDGNQPLTAVTQQGTKVYGVARQGAERLMIYSIDHVTQAYNKFVLPLELKWPHSGLVAHPNGKLYGAAGALPIGPEFIYEYNPEGQVLNIKADLTGRTDINSVRSLTYLSEGKLIGLGAMDMTPVIFEFDITDGEVTKTYEFGPMDGSLSYEDLVVGPDGWIYGTTAAGGVNNGGVLFRINSESGAFEKLKDFDEAGGRWPGKPVFDPSNGRLYIFNYLGGTNGYGSICEYDPANENFDVIHFFQTPGVFTEQPPIIRPGGKIFGALRAPGGQVAGGSIFEFDRNAATLEVRSSFSGQTGYMNPTISFVLVKRDQQVSFAPLETHTAIDAPFELEASATSELPVTFISSNPAFATISGSELTITGVGETTITATQVGDQDYNPAFVARTLVIIKASQTISFEMPAEKFVGDVFDLEATSTSGLPVTYASNNAEVAVVTDGQLEVVGEGTATITATQPGDDRYEPAEPVLRELVATRVAQVVTFEEIAPRQVGDSFGLVATSSSGLDVSFASDNEDVATISGNQLTVVGIGTAMITATQPGNEMYMPAEPVTRTLEVTMGTQVITFSELEGKTFGDDAFDLIASSSSGLPVTFTSSEPGVATINGATVTIAGAGTTTITASQEGNDNYTAAVSITHTMEVAKAAQVITFIVANKTLGDASFDLGAASTSGLPVAYSSVSDKLTIDGNTATLVKAGRLTVLASQEGNSNYEPAESVEQSFCINPAKPSITSNTSADEVTLTSSNDEGNQWYNEGDAIDGAVANTFTTDESGSYTVQTTIDDCVSATSDSFDLIVTGVNGRSESGMKIYPNPTSDFVIVEVKAANREELKLEVFDALGRMVQSRIGSTNTAERLDLGGYGAGMYKVVARSESSRYSGSVLKK